MDSILTSIKKMLGITEADTSFDPDIIMHINSTFFVLHQLGVDDEPFIIEDKSTTWDEYLEEGKAEAIKSYMYLKVRLLFDPPTNAALLNAIKESVKEYESRLNYEFDPVDKED